MSGLPRVFWKIERYRLRGRIHSLQTELAEVRAKCRAQDAANAELRAELLAAEATVEILSAGGPTDQRSNQK